jgi:hypothetical protein
MKGFRKGNGNLGACPDQRIGHIAAGFVFARAFSSTLDRIEVAASILTMKAGFVLSVVLALFADRVLAQQSNVSMGRTNAAALSFDTAVSPYLNPELESKGAELRLGKALRARGPLVHLFHTRKAGEVPKRFWQLINPFSRSEAAPESEVIHARDLSPRAWTATVGWHPGVSTFTYSLTQPEGGQGIGLVSIGH